MVLRAASPSVPAGGRVKASGLKKPTPVSIGKPVACARPLPTVPVPPAFAWLPSSRAVNGVPDDAVAPPLRVQSFNRRSAQPDPRNSPVSPTGEVRIKKLLKL